MRNQVALKHLSDIATPKIQKAGTSIDLTCDERPRLFYLFAGSAKIYRLHPDGRSKIIRFVLNGETFGPPIGTHNECMVEFMEASSVAIVIEENLNICRERHPGLNGWLYEQALEEAHRLTNHSMLLSLGRVEDKLLAFFKDFQLQCKIAGRYRNPMTLPMQRSDIADYLQIAPETLSRVMSKLKAKGLVTVSPTGGGVNELSVRCEAVEKLCTACVEKMCREVV